MQITHNRGRSIKMIIVASMGEVACLPASVKVSEDVKLTILVRSDPRDLILVIIMAS